MRRDHAKIKDVSSLYSFMRYNDFQNDPLGSIEGCDPPNNPAGSISNRADLYNGTCVFDEYDWMVKTSG